MTIAEPYIAGDGTISRVWGSLLLQRMKRGVQDIPAVLSITAFEEHGTPTEDPEIRGAVDGLIADLRTGGSTMNTVKVSAMVVFPYQEWVRKGKPRHEDFREYCLRFGERLIRLDSRNRMGTYFLRMMQHRGVDADGNVAVLDQIGKIIRIWKHYGSKGKRPCQGAMQISCLDPCKDTRLQTRKVFPCLHQIGLSWSGDAVALHAYYPTQYVIGRAYGNYLGVCHLGGYISHHLGMALSRVNCFIGSVKLDMGKTDPRLEQTAQLIKAKLGEV